MRYYFLLLLLFPSFLIAEEIHWLQLPKEQLDTPQRLQIFQQLINDFELHYEWIDIYANDAQQQALEKHNFKFTIKQKNLSQFYINRASNPLRRSTRFGGFRTYEQINDLLRQLAHDYPQWVALISVGFSYEGREILALRLSDNPQHYEPQEPTIWFDALHHAREPMSAESLLYFVQWFLQHRNQPQTQRLLKSRNILLLPCVNPDGYVYNQQQSPLGGGLWRKNRRLNDDGSYGVDLNRNYAWQWGQAAGSNSQPSHETYHGKSAFSEPETAHIQSLLNQQPPTISLTIHSFSNLWMYPWGYQAEPTLDAIRFHYYSEKMTEKNNYINRTAWALFGTTNGAADDYHYGQLGSLAFTVEIGNANDGFWPAPERIEPLAQSVLTAYQSAIESTGAWLKIKQTSFNRQKNEITLLIENQGTAMLNAKLSINSLNHTTAEQQVQLPPMEQRAVYFSVDDNNLADISQLFFTLLSEYDGVKSAEDFWVDIEKQPTTHWSIPTELRSHQNFTIQLNTLKNTEIQIYYALAFEADENHQLKLQAPLYPLFEGRTDEHGQINQHLNLPEPLPFSGETVYLQAVISDNTPFLSPMTAVELLY